MRAFNFITALTAAALLTCGTLAAQDAPYDEQFRYIEVTGTSEVEIIPDEIHFVIGIKEYFEEEFDGKSKPEDYRTKVRIETIELTATSVPRTWAITGGNAVWTSSSARTWTSPCMISR